MDIGNLITIGIYLISFGTSMGVITTKISNIEKKQDEQNDVKERIALIEREDKAQWKAIDELKKAVRKGEKSG